MTHDEITGFLKEHQITYNFSEKSWFYGRLKVGSPDNVFNMPMFLAMTKLDLDDIKEYMEKYVARPGKSEASLADYAVGLFFDELGMNPNDRCYLDKSIPKYVVSDGFKSFPFEESCPSRKCNEAKLRMYFTFMMKNSKNPKFSMLSHPENLLVYYIDRAKRKFEDDVIEKVKYDPNAEKASDFALKELYNLYMPAFISFGTEHRFDYGMFKAVIMHFIWHIKNKAIFGRNQEPIMLNISGGQGCGKTQFIRHLFKSILGNLFTETTISVLNDEFGASLLYESWLLFFDELIRKNGELDVDRLKQIITSTEIKNREIFTSQYTTTFVRSAFIGAANTPIYEVIDDPTGMRRYINLEFTNNRMTSQKPLHKLLDILWEQRGLSIWKSVDENRPNGYLVDDYEKMMEVAQRTYFSPNNTVYRFIHDQQIEIVTKGTKDCVTNYLDDLYNGGYREYCKDHDILPQYRVSLEGFKRKIKQLYDAKNDTNCKMANLRYKTGTLVPPEKTTLEHWLLDGGDLNPELGCCVIPESFDQYKEFVPQEIPDSDIIIKLPEPTPEAATGGDAEVPRQTSGTETKQKFYIDEKGRKVYYKLADALFDAEPGVTVKIEADLPEGTAVAIPDELAETAEQPPSEPAESATTEPVVGGEEPETASPEPAEHESGAPEEGAAAPVEDVKSSVFVEMGLYEMPSLEEILGLTEEEKSELNARNEEEKADADKEIHQIHQIYRDKVIKAIDKSSKEESVVDGGLGEFAVTDPEHFRKQAIQIHEDEDDLTGYERTQAMRLQALLDMG